MPNWCSNWVSITTDNPENIKKIEAAVKDEKLFEAFAPIGDWDYGNAVETWGTKWDISNADVQHTSDKSIEIYFDTAWGPPIEFYNKLTEQGFNIDATYHESGMQFAGHYTSEDGDECYEYDFSDENWREGIEDGDVLDILESEYESHLEWEAMNEESEDGEEE